jgi:cation diffusion facilitator CzcD-associated flavoprotein CzcO
LRWVYQLRAKVTPRWQIGCKRILMSNTYYPALAQPHVDVVTDGIAAVRPNAIVSVDGSVREVDAIVVATGFHVTDSPTNECIIGRGGHSLADTWQRAGAQAYRGSTVHGFPNLFVMTGPGTASGDTSAKSCGSSGVCHVDTLDLAVEGEGRLVVVVQRHRRAEADADVEAVVGGE